jgi:hypothetical protein
VGGLAAGPVQRRLRQQPVPGAAAVLQVARRRGGDPGPDGRAQAARVPDKPVPVFTGEELSRLERACAGRGFRERRDAAVIAVLEATRIRLSELAQIRYNPADPLRSDVSLWRREITVNGKGGKTRVVKVSYAAARCLDRYIRGRARHAEAYRPQLWLGVNNRGPMTASGIYQMIVRRGRQCGFSHTWLDLGGAEGDLTELNGWMSPQMLRRYGASARCVRARRSYDRVMKPGYRSRVGDGWLTASLSHAPRSEAVLSPSSLAPVHLSRHRWRADCEPRRESGQLAVSCVFASPQKSHKSGSTAVMPTRNPRTKRHYPAHGGTVLACSYPALKGVYAGQWADSCEVAFAPGQGQTLL